MSIRRWLKNKFDIETGDEHETLPVTIGDEVIVWDRYRFAIPLPAVVECLSDSNDGVKVRLLRSNNRFYPIGCTTWVHVAQLGRI